MRRSASQPERMKNARWYVLRHMSLRMCLLGMTAGGLCGSKAPDGTTEREDGWRGFYIQGVLDFSLIGILSELSRILAENRIGIFAVSTYNTDYLLVKQENWSSALDALRAEGYEME